MKYLLCLFFALLHVAQSTDDIMEAEGYYYDHRKRTGHFNDHPYTDLYLNYVQVFIAPAYKGTDVHQTDSYKNYAASAEHCFSVFEQFKQNNYELEKIEKLVELDSCLGYLYDEEYTNRYHAIDKQRDIVAERLDGYIEDSKLRALYDGTQVHKLNKDAKVCVGELLLKTIQIKEQYPNLACNNHHIELLNRFGACHSTIPEELRQTDSYLSILYKLIKVKGNECFIQELRAVNNAVRTKFANSADSKIPSIFRSTQAKQMKNRMWPKPIRELLAAVQNATSSDQINLRHILGYARAVYVAKTEPQNSKLVQNLLHNLEKYAVDNIKLNRVDSSLGLQDEDGRLRYKKLINGLCSFFRSSDRESSYDYATAFARLVKMLEYHELFGIDRKYFVDTVINGYEVAPTYTSIVACNIISFTQGVIRNEGRTKTYHVSFVPDCSAMVKWPDAGYF